MASSSARPSAARESRIRPFVEADMPEVTSLYERVARSGSRTPPPKLGDYFRRMYLEHPWVDPEIPSLVYELSDGGIVGFLGSHARRLRFDGQPVRMACSGQLVTAPEHRQDAPGVFLLRDYFSGPQELTITDGANEPARRLWEGLGGETLHLSTIDWIRVFRPLTVGAEYALRRREPGRALRTLTPVTGLVDSALKFVPRTPFRVARPAASIEELTPEVLVDELETVAQSYRLRPDYDEPFLQWLFREMAEVRTRGELTRSLVRAEDGRVLGWYIAYVKAGRVSDIVQIAAIDHGLGTVLDQALHDAFQHGASAVRGRIEPRLLRPLWSRRCVLRYSAGALAHARSPEILRAIRAGKALLTRMDGEWWMGHHVEAFS